MDGQTTINVNGKEVGVRYNRYAIEQSFLVKGTSTMHKNILAQIWGGIQGFAFAKQIDAVVSFEEVVDWLENIETNGDPENQIQRINEAFQSSNVYKGLEKIVAASQDEKPEEKESNDEVKKKTVLIE